MEILIWSKQRLWYQWRWNGWWN